MPVQVDVDALREHGYVLIEGVVPVAVCDSVVDLICDYLGVRRDRSDPAWERRVGEVYNGIVPLHQHQALWDARQQPRMHEAFARIYDDPRLWVTVDRCSYKPRLSRRAHARPGDPNRIHVDQPVLDTSAVPVQGVLYLTDTAAEQGAWECVPAVFRELRDGVRASFERGTDLTGYEIRRVPGPAGSLVVWDGRMPHSSGHNWTDTPRFAQYITMHPEGDEAERRERIDNWRERRAPRYWRNMPNQPDPEPWPAPARLTALGQRLLGLASWDG